MTSDELSLLAAIHAAPKDDTPRLVYADWLDEHGESDAAEFIRLLCHEPELHLTNGGRPSISPGADERKYHSKHPARCRAQDLLDRLYGTIRYPKVGDIDWYVRGLPVYHVDVSDEYLRANTVPLERYITPLMRADLRLTTARLGEWLRHPLMHYADWLYIVPEPLGDAQEWTDHCNRFWAAGIPLLAESGVTDRLGDLCLSGWVSRENREMAVRLLGSRVRFDD